MKLRKVLAVVAAGALAVSAMAVSASANSIVTPAGALLAGAQSGGGMALVQAWNSDPDAPVDLGVTTAQLAELGTIAVTVKPVDGEFEFEDADRSSFGGGIVLSVQSEAEGGSDSRNWNNIEWWGIGSDILDTSKAGQFVENGDGTYTAKWENIPAEYRPVDGDAVVQVALQEWGSAMSGLEVEKFDLLTDSGSLIVSIAATGARLDASAPAAGSTTGTTGAAKGGADTGAADVAAVIGLAIVAGGAVVLSRKKK